MKEKLHQLFLAEFIDLVCGNPKVLLGRREVVTPIRLAETTRAIVLEYRSIADPGGTAAYFKHVEDWLKARVNVILFTMCDNLVTLGQYARAREVLTDYGLSPTKWSDSRVAGAIQAKLAQWQRELDAIESDNDKAAENRKDIQAQFDEQVATIMAHFKFQIDPATIRATMYANLVARYSREVKARQAALKQK